MKKLDITGVKFGKLTAIRQNGADVSPSRRHIKWDCVCDCGSLTSVRLNNLSSGNAKSCGCIKKSGDKNRTHGMSGSYEYTTWHRMKLRCLKESHQDYHLYGARGISVCKEWTDSFDAFFSDMGMRPTKNHSIDRIDNAGDYCSKNCRWADDFTQSRNKRNNVFYELDGERMCQTDWAKRIGINVSSLIERVKKYGVHIALTTLKGERH